MVVSLTKIVYSVNDENSFLNQPLSLLTHSLPLQFDKHKVDEIGYSLKKVKMKLNGEIIL